MVVRCFSSRFINFSSKSKIWLPLSVRKCLNKQGIEKKFVFKSKSFDHFCVSLENPLSILKGIYIIFRKIFLSFFRGKKDEQMVVQQILFHFSGVLDLQYKQELYLHSFISLKSNFFLIDARNMSFLRALPESCVVFAPLSKILQVSSDDYNGKFFSSLSELVVVYVCLFPSYPVQNVLWVPHFLKHLSSCLFSNNNCHSSHVFSRKL